MSRLIVKEAVDTESKLFRVMYGFMNEVEKDASL